MIWICLALSLVTLALAAFALWAWGRLDDIDRRIDAEALISKAGQIKSERYLEKRLQKLEEDETHWSETHGTPDGGGS